MPKKKKIEAAKADPLKLERVIETVKHNFVDDELISFGYKLGQKYRSIRTVQSEAKAVAADYKAREKSLEADIDEISGKLNAGFEMRGKPCYKFIDYKAGRVYWFLCDDVGEPTALNWPDAEALLEHLLLDESFGPVKQRPIRDHERQTRLFPDEPNPEAQPEAQPEADEKKPDQVVTE